MALTIVAVAASAAIFMVVGALAASVTDSDAVGGTAWLVGTGVMTWWLIRVYRRRSAERRARVPTRGRWAEAERLRETQRRSAEQHARQQQTDRAERSSAINAALARRDKSLSARDAPSAHGAPTLFAVDRTASAVRTEALQDYLSAHVLDPRGHFICSSAHSCKTSALSRPGTAFLEAQGHSVGPAYDLATEAGAPYRVLVIPMEVGGSNPENHHRTMNQRTRDILASGELPFRARNPHMKGVTFALRLAFGLPVDDDQAEYLHFTDGTTAQLFSCFAMTNLLMCSAVATGTMSSRSTRVMRANCSRHMATTVDILQPTLVISQGAQLDQPLRTALGVTRVLSPNLSECERNGHRFFWASLYHPTRNWSALSHPYLRDTVIPTIEEARARALTLP
ncbi:hypothetical protein [Mycobacterium sp. GA-2829]|uniref:hypothetical protein n=1 Tax=Mycobacterium sp. GA-2829 TaxID=1772283 RepID=UPI00073FAA8E|nr:hypothetical protein [Mycobacterium sp. GA-2829]KUI34196.1 hypothetical protein AU194_17755 [Mycobacterium sp. GA-2829]